MRQFNQSYPQEQTLRLSFPIGGIGAGMFGLEGNGMLGSFSLKNKPDVFHQPDLFSAVCIQGDPNRVYVLEGQVQPYKIFGSKAEGLAGSGNGAHGRTYGLPRFEHNSFLSRFPFGRVTLTDEEIPLDVEIEGFSPFILGNADDSSLPVGSLTYRFTNKTDRPIDAIYYFNAFNFVKVNEEAKVIQTDKGFIFHQPLDGLAHPPISPPSAPLLTRRTPGWIPPGSGGLSTFLTASPWSGNPWSRRCPATGPTKAGSRARGRP